MTIHLCVVMPYAGDCEWYTTSWCQAALQNTPELCLPNINNLRYAADTIFMAESEEELKSLLMKSERKQ